MGSVVLETYFNLISTFSQDRAREVVLHEKDSVKNNQVYQHLLGVLVQLAGAEKQYLALSFLHQTRSSVFLRKETSLRVVYQTIQVECAKVVDGELALVSEMVGEMVRVRGVMLEVYEKLAGLVLNSSTVAPYAELAKSLSRLGDNCEVECVGKEWARVVGWELEMLRSCLSCLSNIQSWDLFSSLLLLQNVSDQMTNWETLVSARETRKLSFASSLFRGVAGSGEPALYLWLHRLKSALMSKFSLYFHLPLSRQTTNSEMKSLCSKLSLDQSGRLGMFQKKVDAQSVSLLLDTTSLSTYRGQCGYIYPDSDTRSSPAGLDQFPLVFSTPTTPTQYLPNIVMILTDHSTDLSNGRTVNLYDQGVETTFFLHQVEPNYFLVILFEGRRTESYNTVNLFMVETATQLRCAKVFTSLKSGSK